MAQRNDTQLQAHLHAALGTLLDAVAHQEGQDALGLVVLHHADHIGSVVGLTQHHSHAGDVAGDQGHAQVPDEGVGQVAELGLTIFCGAVELDCCPFC